MNRHTKKDALLHAKLAIQHPSRADSLEREIKTTRHSRSTEESEVREESAAATSTPRPPPLIPPPLMPAQAARLPPLMPAHAATKSATEKGMPPVLFKKPESYVRAKKLVTLKKPLADAIISKMIIQGSRSVSFNKNSNNDPLATFKNIFKIYGAVLS